MDGIAPRVTAVMIGTNNSGRDRNTPAEILEGVTAVVASNPARFDLSVINRYFPGFEETIIEAWVK